MDKNINKNKKKSNSLRILIIGFVLAWNNSILQILGVIEKPNRAVNPWNWGYDISGMISVIGTVIAIVGLIKVIRNNKKQ